MFILVNHCQDTGLMELGRYDTREEAAKDIALIIAEDYQIAMQRYTCIAN